jgi:hypothetical protein
MPRAGSGWYYNLIHDLVVAHGGQDARLIRERYRLERFLTEVNCNLSTLKPLRLIPVQVPSIFGNRFVIKTHAGPTTYALWTNQKKIITFIYIFRDPRAAMLSAYEYGQNALSDGRRNAFSHLTSLDSAAEFMLFYVKIWEAWSKADGVLIVKYEQLVRDFYAEFSRLAAFLGIEAEQNDLSSIHDSYRPDKGDSRQKGMHFNKGQVERFREVFSPTQLQQYTKYFEPYLEGMGYA